MIRLYNKGMVSSVALVTAFLAAGCGGSVPSEPNVMMVVISGLRADHLSSYGYRRETTPSIDQLAESGTLFENAIGASPVRLSSQASIMTGLYTSEHGVTAEKPRLDPSLQTLAERLEARGYETFGVSTAAEISGAMDFDQGFDTFVEVVPDEEGLPDDGAAVAETRLLEWLASRAGVPTFSYVLLKNPELPFSPPGEYAREFIGSSVTPSRVDELMQLWIPFARRYSLELERLRQDDLETLIALYDGEVAYADYRVGRIVEGLKEMATLDRTLLIVTSDVGEDLGDHGLLASASDLFDTMVRVPLVMRLPGSIPAGLRVTDQVQTLALADAIASFVDPEREKPVGSPMPMSPVAFAEAKADREALSYYQSIVPAEDLILLDRDLIAARTLQHKFILTSRGTAALFDLEADPGETRSILSENPETAGQLMVAIEAWGSKLGKAPGAEDAP